MAGKPPTADKFLRERATEDLPPDQAEELARLLKGLRHGPPSQLLFVEFGDSVYRDRLITRINSALGAEGMQSATLHVLRDAARFTDVERELATKIGLGLQLLHVVDGEHWFTPDRWEEFNVRREVVTRDIGGRMLFWLSADQIRDAALHAVDLWHWRAGVFTFVVPSGGPGFEVPAAVPAQAKSEAERQARIAILEAQIETLPHDESYLQLRIEALSELAELHRSLGAYDEALRLLHGPLADAVRTRGSPREEAARLGTVADVLIARGERREALDLMQKRVLPTIESIGDLRVRAHTAGRVADLFEWTGEPRKALDLRTSLILPIYDALGDAFGRAATLHRIANRYVADGRAVEGIRLLETDVLPIYEHHGSRRERAMALGTLANAFRHSGRVDDAIAVLRDEVIPELHRLGDAREWAVFSGTLAAAEVARGRVSEGTRILRDDVLPVLRRLGERPNLVLTCRNLATLLQKSGRGQDRAEARRLLREALAAADSPDMKNEINAEQKALR